MRAVEQTWSRFDVENRLPLPKLSEGPTLIPLEAINALYPFVTKDLW